MKRLLVLVLFATAMRAETMFELRDGDVHQPFTKEQRAWRELIASRLASWPWFVPSLARPYDPAPGPERVAIVISNNAARDAFTIDAQTIGFDVAKLHAEYGDAQSNENRDRIDRLFRHEYAHLLQKSWLRTHPYDASSTFKAALLGVWLEGLGNYHSMSDRWRGESPIAAATLKKLEPRFAARMAALACATPEGANVLMADMNETRFEDKWGGLTLALWIEAEMRTDADAYRRLVHAGPDAIPELAKRHLSPELAAVMDETVSAAQRCSSVR